MNNLPVTYEEWLDQIVYYEWLKVTFPPLYPKVVAFMERPECAL